jgi:AAA+ superfamily predicted ATPase
MSLTATDKKEIETIVKKEIKDFLSSTQAHKTVIDMVKKEMGTRDINDKVVELSTKVVVELFKQLWQRKSFWEGSLKNVK